MKPMGAVPTEIAAALPLIAGRRADEWLGGQDGPVFVYDMALVRARIEALRRSLPSEVAIHYAVKANPFAQLLAAMAPLVDGFDVASAGELAAAAAYRPGAAIGFAGPGKRDAELAAAITAGATINLESAGEARRALAAGDRLGIVPRLAVRINPPFELRGSGMKMGGRASPFGVEVEAVPALVADLLSAGADWQGFHVYAGSQCLDTDAIIESLSRSAMLTMDLAQRIGRVPPLVNLGGGFGIPYAAGDRPIDVERIGAELSGHLWGEWRAERYALELGRWLVGEAGTYLTRVVDRKTSGGETFLVVDGGMHHQLAASGNLGMAVRRNYPMAVPGGDPASAETVNVVGCLCTPLDRLGDRVSLPRAEPGDVVAIFMAGAYGLTASPTGFLGHPPPAEMLANEQRA